MFSLLREDLIYTDVPKAYKWTCIKQEGFMNYSQIFKEKCQGYRCLPDGTLEPTTARTVNLKQLFAVFKSKDEKVFEENQWMFDGQYRFLDKESIDGQHVNFTSYPRSGNSFLRRYLESVTGICTGSTMSIHQSTSLQIMGMYGESKRDDSVFIVKSHHPFYLKLATVYDSNKTIYVVRDPVDSLPSYCSLINCMNHATKPEYPLDGLPEYWDWFVRSQSDQMKKFMDIFRRQFQEEKVNPVYIVRYEDLVEDPRNTLQGLFGFLLESDDLEGSNIMRRIDQVIAQGRKATTTYALKGHTGQFHYNKKMYSDDQLKYMRETLADHLYYFGYSNDPNGEDNFTGFYDFEQHDPKHVQNYYGFRKDNERNTKDILSEGYQTKHFKVNQEGVFDLFTHEEGVRFLQPSKDYAEKTIKEALAKKQQTPQ